MDGFFDKEETFEERTKTVSSCGGCGLHKFAMSPKMKVGGEGRKKILVIAEAPGEVEDRKNDQLIGRAGELTYKLFKKEGIDLHKDCFKYNAINCRPSEDGKLKNRPPNAKEIEACRPKVLKVIRQTKPKLIILMGGGAVKSFLGHRWKKNLRGITRWRGWTIPDREVGAWVCPIYHPSFVLRSSMDYRGKVYNVAKVIFKDDLKRAISMLNKPFPKFKDERQLVKKLYSKKDIIKFLRLVNKHEPPLICIDYETTGLKPHVEGHEIVAMSISTTPNNATAFPLIDEAVPYLKAVLKNKKIKKIIANLGFEQLWSRVLLKRKIRGIYGDPVEAAHILDNRKYICSVKFQTFVRFGVADYDQFVSPFLKAPKKKGGNAFNRIHKIKLDKLLTYVGLDTIYEYRIVLEQHEELGIKSII